MEIRRMPIDRLNPAPYNPRKDLKPGDPEYERLKKSIMEFDLVEPLVWNKQTGRLVSGHQRLKVLRELGYKEVEVSVVDLPEDKEKALNVALNKIQGEWDEEKLEALLEELYREGLWELTGFDAAEIKRMVSELSLEESPYTYKVEAVHYQPGEEAPDIEELVDRSRYEELLRAIEVTEVDERVKQFLRLAATRFLRFNYAKIADYYAHADAAVQRLFEELALVIIDFEDAIAKGFVRFCKRIEEMLEEEHPDGE
jgi:ParB-like chromosome segregation protein Spo0J